MKQAVLVLSGAAMSLSSANAKVAQSHLAQKVHRIEQECKLRSGTLTAVGDEVQFAPLLDEKYERVDCALEKLKKGHVEKLGFIGNAYDPNAVLQEPYRYIAEGTATQISSLAAAARVSGWTIVKLAKAEDGTSFLVFQSGKGETVGGADRLMQRLWRREFGALMLGRAPEPLVEPTQDTNR